MKSKIEFLNNLLKKHKIQQPVPSKIRKNILKRRRKSLIKILKDLKRYNLLYGLLIWLFFLLKHIGLRLSIYQTVIVLAVTSSIVVISVSSGTYIIYKKITNSSNNQKIYSENINQDSKNNNILDIKKDTSKIDKNKNPQSNEKIIKPVKKIKRKPLVKYKISKENFIVSSRKNWQNSDIVVKKGDLVEVQASGIWSIDPKYKKHSADGSDEYPNWPDPPIVKDAPWGALIGRINSETPFFIGAKKVFKVKSSGKLKFHVNDSFRGIYNNSGKITLNIILKSKISN